MRGGPGRRGPAASQAGRTDPGRRQPTGGLLDGSQSAAAITALLQADAGSYTWVGAASAPTPRPATSSPPSTR